MDSNEQLIFEEIIYSLCKECEERYHGIWEMCEVSSGREDQLTYLYHVYWTLS